MRGHRPVHFLHIGKTGGSALRSALSAGRIRGPWALRLHQHDFLLTDVPLGEGAIFFLRDPVSRFTSAFFGRLYEGAPAYHFPWSVAERRVFEHFRTPDQLATALSSSSRAERDFAEEAMRSIRHVRSLYREWLISERYLRSRLSDLFFIGFQESLQDDFERLKAKLVLAPGAALPAGDRQANRTPAHLDRSLSEEGEANLRAWYREDQELITLCRELIAANPTLNGLPEKQHDSQIAT